MQKYLLTIGTAWLALAVGAASPCLADSGKVRVTALSFDDTSSSNSGASSGVSDLGADILQEDCDPDPTAEDLEPFTFLSARLKLRNSGTKSYRLRSVRFYIKGQTAGVSYTSPKLSNFVLVPPSKTADDATDVAVLLGTPVSGQKLFYGSSTAMPDNLGTAKVTIRLYFRVGGKTITKKVSSSLLFANLDRCNS